MRTRSQGRQDEGGGASRQHAKKRRRLTNIGTGRSGASQSAAASQGLVSLADLTRMQSALKQMDLADTLRQEIEKLKLKEKSARVAAVRGVIEALPYVESLVQSASAQLADQVAPKSVQRAYSHARHDSKIAVLHVREALSLGHGAEISAAGSQLLVAAGRVVHQLQQAHATLAAANSKANDGACTILQALGIDEVRRIFMDNFSLTQLWRCQRVCRDFCRWSKVVLSGIRSVPMHSVRGLFADWARIDCVGVGWPSVRMQVRLPDREHKGMGEYDSLSAGRGITEVACAAGAGGSMFMVGGSQNQVAHDQKTATEISTAIAWRASQWAILPSLPIATANASICSMVMPEGDEALVVIGGTKAAKPIDTVQILRNGKWTELASLPVVRFGYSICALSKGRIVVVGGSSRDFKSSRHVIMLDIVENTWSNLPELTQQRYRPCVVAVEDNVIVLGGRDMTLPRDQRSLASCEQLRLCDTGGGWTEFPSLPMAPTPYTSLADNMHIQVERGCICKYQEQLQPDAVTNLDPAVRYNPDKALLVYDMAIEKWHTKILPRRN